MADNDLSISAISNRKLEEVGEKAQVLLLKKNLNQQGEVAKQLIESAVQPALPEGVGGKVNTVA